MVAPVPRVLGTIWNKQKAPHKCINNSLMHINTLISIIINISWIRELLPGWIALLACVVLPWSQIGQLPTKYHLVNKNEIHIMRNLVGTPHWIKICESHLKIKFQLKTVCWNHVAYFSLHIIIQIKFPKWKLLMPDIYISWCWNVVITPPDKYAAYCR